MGAQTEGAPAAEGAVVTAAMREPEPVTQRPAAASEKAQPVAGQQSRTPTSGTVPLTTFIKIVPGFTPLVINRQGQFPVATISFNLAKNAALSDAMRVIERTKENLNIPASVQTSFEGSAKTNRK